MKTPAKSTPSRGSSKRFEMFEFNEAEEGVEKTSNKILGKYKNPIKSSDSPLTKYTFLQCFAQGIKTKRNDSFKDSLEVEAGDDSVEEGLSGLDPIAPSISLNLASANCTKNELVTIDSDDDNFESSSTTTFSKPAGNEGALEEQALELHFGGCAIDETVVICPDYVIYGDTYCTKARVTFSSSCIKVEGSAVCGIKGPFNFECPLGDVINIECQWCGQVQTAVVNLRLKLQGKELAEHTDIITGIAELRFAVHDPSWYEQQEAIKLLNVRYGAKWSLVCEEIVDRSQKDILICGLQFLELFSLSTDAARSEDCCQGNNNIFISKHYFCSRDDSFEEVIYPKGDADAVSISMRDIELLQPETFINDTIIDFYIKYLEKKIKPEEKHRFHFFNSFFFRKLADLDKEPSGACEGRAAFQRVCKWTRKVNLFEKDYIFIPINFSLHWSLIVICHPGDTTKFEDEDMQKLSKVPCILHMDSIKGSHKGLKNLIQSYLREEWKERQNQLEDDVSSKILNLRFVPLQLPQQENSFDCGIFLLHYVELFLERAPVCFNPFKITKFPHFLTKDWFHPAEASLKRAHIKKLIYQIIEDDYKKAPLAPCDEDEHLFSELPSIDEKEICAEFQEEIYRSPELCQSHYSSPIPDKKIGLALSKGTPLRDAQCSKEQDSIGGLLSVEDCHSFGQMVLLDRVKNIMSPIEEGGESSEQLVYPPTGMGDVQQQAKFTEPLIITYSGKEYRTLEASSEIEFNEDHLFEELWGSNPAGERSKSESPSTSSDELVDGIVEDSEEEDRTFNVKDSGKSPLGFRKIIGTSNKEARSSKIIVQVNNRTCELELDKKLASKRPRPLPPGGGRQRLKRSSKDIHEVFSCE